MKILNVRVLRGPNYWSNNRQKLIEIKLDLGAYEELPSNCLGDFSSKLKGLIPTLYSHRCSPGIEGGFFLRLEEGTWLGHVIEHVALELQTLAGMDCGFGRTYSAHEKGVYHVIFAYEIENAGLLAGQRAIQIVQSLAEGKDYLFLERDLSQLRELFAEGMLGPSTDAIVKEARRRNIPVARFKETSLITLGQGCYQKKIWAATSSQTSAIAVDIVADKEMTKQILASSFIPIPEGLTVASMDDLDKAIEQLGFPLVIKPRDGNHGRGVTTNIHNKERAISAFNLARKSSANVIAERFIEGNDYRFLVINHRVVAVAKRIPAMILGNGIDSIQQLIEKTNQDPRRGMSHEKPLTSIKIDESTLSILEDKHLTLQSVLGQGESLYLKNSANLSSGGTAIDVTEQVHPDNIRLAERISRLVQLDVCGIDIVAHDIRSPIDEKKGAVIEVNAGPGLRMHLSPGEGRPRNVAAPFLDMLYPAASPCRIPIVAVTGTNGKTTVVRLVAQFAKQANYHVGFTTTEGIYIDDHLISRGDCSGPRSAEVVLKEPSVNFAVLECARGGILRSGLGFDQCDISIITNISEDHLGLDDIHSIEDLARLKAVVAYSTMKNGHAILNADDDLVYMIKEEVHCNVALFALEESKRIKAHCSDGGLAAFIEDNQIVIQQGPTRYALARVKDIPLTFNGTAECMIKNILPAVLAGFIAKFPIKRLEQTLGSLRPSMEYTPGRMNVFDFNDFQVIIDYAHNEDAYIQLKKFIDSMDYKRKTGIIAASGDRKGEDIQKLGYYAAQIFDEIIIRHNKDGRGRTNQQITDLILQGIRSVNPSISVKVISNEFAAIRYAMADAAPDTLIYCSVDDVFDSLAFMVEEKKVFAAKMANHETFSL
ncbi:MULTISPECIES: cyanophycin synthetase [unclassified Legionella]|uniref:cyanophycin synthetase n=1 Tax=unclassified Legionella TaxID=2622702 RepID=UPI001054718A|nr:MULTISPECIES: cyanophycin synthetase [unclassified Legionella]MDI9817841.1 cyanophycin synthetase [Legionella sp. PL877]